MNAISHARPARESSKHRVSKTATAADSLAGFGHDTEVDVLTFGQFSIIDAIEAVLDITGPSRPSQGRRAKARSRLGQA